MLVLTAERQNANFLADSSENIAELQPPAPESLITHLVSFVRTRQKRQQQESTSAFEIFDIFDRKMEKKKKTVPPPAGDFSVYFPARHHRSLYRDQTVSTTRCTAIEPFLYI